MVLLFHSLNVTEQSFDVLSLAVKDNLLGVVDEMGAVPN